MRLKHYSERNQDSSKLQRMNLKVPTIYYPISKENFNKHSRSLPKLVSKFCHSIVVDLPADARLDDLASLLQLDSKNMNVEQFGIDLIKEQQKINLKFSSNQTAVISEDRAQIMLAGVHMFCTLKCEHNLRKISVAFEHNQNIFSI